MYDTSPLTPFKGETKPFLHLEIDTKTLDSLFDLHPSLENSFDLTEFVSGAVVVSSESAATSPPGVPDSAVVTSPVASSATDLLTLSSAATSQHLAEIERHSGIGSNNNHHNNNNNNNFVPQQTSPGAVVPSTPSPVNHLHHHHHLHHHPQQQQQQQQQPAQQVQGYQQSLSPSLTVDDVSQAFSDDSCVFMPEYEQLAISSAAPVTSGGSSGLAWGQEPYYTTVKTEDLGLSTLTACSLEASLPGFTNTTTTTTTTTTSSSSSSSSSAATNMGCKMEEFDDAAGHYSGGGAAGFSPSRRSVRSLSESSTATTTSTIPDSPRRMGKGGSKRRQVPKGSEEYKEKRARNNVAVRKSRAKAKEKQKITEGRVKQLMDHNDSLTKKVEMLTKELTVLRGLFVNVGATLPDDFSKLMEQS